MYITIANDERMRVNEYPHSIDLQTMGKIQSGTYAEVYLSTDPQVVQLRRYDDRQIALLVFHPWEEENIPDWWKGTEILFEYRSPEKK